MPFNAIMTLRKLCNHPALAFRKGRVVWSKTVELKKNKKRMFRETTSGSRSMRGKSAVVMNKLTGKSNSVSTGKPSKQIGGTCGGVSAGRRKRRSDDSESDKDSDENREQCEDDEEEDFPLNEVAWEDSGKLLVLSKVLPLWHREGHKVLLFSQTQSMLNLIEVLLRDHFNFRFMRLDGSTAIAKRQSIIDTFNSDPSVFLMLLTTRTGGVGISLTAANRVVLLDPDWNPQTDVQV